MWAYRLEEPSLYVRHEIDAPDPEQLVDGEVVLRFRTGGVCGSDLARFRSGGETLAPQPFGRSLHEIVGDVIASKSDLAVGDRVVGWVATLCGLSERVVTPARELAVVPAGLDPIGAVSLQPLACVLGALSRVPNVSGARVAVLGLGPIGMLFAHAVKHLGAKHVVGVDVVDRRDLALDFGIDEVVQSTTRRWSDGVADGPGFDLVVEAIGHQIGTFSDAVFAAAVHGTVLYFGIQDDPVYPVRVDRLMDRNIVLRFGRTPRPERRAALGLAIDYVSHYPNLMERYVTHVFPADEAQKAFEMACRPAPGQLKIVLQDDV